MNNQNDKLILGIELIDDPNWMGGTLYLRNLAICLSRLPPGERPGLSLLGAPGVIKKFLSECGNLPGLYASSYPTLFQRIISKAGFKRKMNAPVDLIYPGFGSKINGAKTIHWIPDFQHRYLPDLFSKKEIQARDQSIANIAARPGVVVLSSETAANDFKQFFPDQQSTPKVWHFCSLLDTSEPIEIDLKSKYGLPKKYLYLPNQFWAHKNHITVLKALFRLNSKYGLTIPLVCTGAQSDQRNLDHFSNLMQFIKEKKMSEQVHLLGLIDRKDQIAVLRSATAVVQPSLFEGWSTVVEDVRATGRPIYLSDIPVHREQSPDDCFYFKAKADEELASMILSQWDDLKPGPDAEAEKKARKELEVRILNSAQVFNGILITARNIPHA